MKSRRPSSARTFSLGNAGLWLIAGLHTLAALSLIFVLGWISPAKAAEDLSCGGKNILADLKKEDPKGFAEIETDTAKLKNGESIFWKIEKPALRPPGCSARSTSPTPASSTCRPKRRRTSRPHRPSSWNPTRSPTRMPPA